MAGQESAGFPRLPQTPAKRLLSRRAYRKYTFPKRLGSVSVVELLRTQIIYWAPPLRNFAVGSFDGDVYRCSRRRLGFLTCQSTSMGRRPIHQSFSRQRLRNRHMIASTTASLSKSRAPDGRDAIFGQLSAQLVTVKTTLDTMYYSFFPQAPFSD